MPPDRFAEARWFGAKGQRVGHLELDEAFELDETAGLLLAVVRVVGEGGADLGRYSLPIALTPDGPREAVEGDGAWRALATAMAEGRTIPALPEPRPAGGSPGPFSAALVCRPAGGLGGLVPGGPSAVGALAERSLGVDQSNTSAVLGERLVFKAFRRLETGLNPDLEVTAFLAEEAGFEAVPRLAGFAELVSAGHGVATVAMLQEYVPDAQDAYESTAELLVGWLLAPGEVALEYATEEAAELGRLTAGLHATLAAARAPGFEPREATRAELRAWREAAERQLATALAVVPPEVRDELSVLAPAIGNELAVFEALPAPPLLTRVHADYHLGQVLRTPDGFVIIDFEGEPTRAIEERRRHNSPLHDVASFLRSIDHVGRSAVRRARARSGGVLERTGLDMDAWLARSRERFLAAYAAGLREGGAPFSLDLDLLRAFEVEKECYEFIYAATYLPEWLWAPLEGMRGLLAEGAGRRAAEDRQPEPLGPF